MGKHRGFIDVNCESMQFYLNCSVVVAFTTAHAVCMCLRHCVLNADLASSEIRLFYQS